MRARRVAGGERLLVLAAVLSLPRVQAECWTRSDGVEICSHDPPGWIVLWWIWLAVLVVAGVLLGYCECWSRDAARRCLRIRDVEVGDDGDHDGKAAFRAPLLSADHGATMEDGESESALHVQRVQPVYRYLDE